MVQVPLRFRFDREVLVFSQAAPLPDVGGGEGKRISGGAGERGGGRGEGSRISGRAGERRLRSLVSCARVITHTCTHRGTGADMKTRTRFLKP